jgi:hypothetical protein
LCRNTIGAVIIGAGIVITAVGDGTLDSQEQARIPGLF